mmetsp:Transcript_5614/g.17763  ORF Transcript_5614/g.17763 Transcript_5614/m.17763 type:complete len:200 (-) Transcript_5614:84-683(-)
MGGFDGSDPPLCAAFLAFLSAFFASLRIWLLDMPSPPPSAGASAAGAAERAAAAAAGAAAAAPAVATAAGTSAACVGWEMGGPTARSSLENHSPSSAAAAAAEDDVSMRLDSDDMAKSPRTVPAAASMGLASPATSRATLTASAPSHAMTTIGPEVSSATASSTAPSVPFIDCAQYWRAWSSDARSTRQATMTRPRSRR